MNSIICEYSIGDHVSIRDNIKNRAYHGRVVFITDEFDILIRTIKFKGQRCTLNADEAEYLFDGFSDREELNSNECYMLFPTYSGRTWDDVEDDYFEMDDSMVEGSQECNISVRIVKNNHKNTSKRSIPDFSLPVNLTLFLDNLFESSNEFLAEKQIKEIIKKTFPYKEECIKDLLQEYLSINIESLYQDKQLFIKKSKIQKINDLIKNNLSTATSSITKDYLMTQLTTELHFEHKTVDYFVNNYIQNNLKDVLHIDIQKIFRKKSDRDCNLTSFLVSLLTFWNAPISINYIERLLLKYNVSYFTCNDINQAIIRDNRTFTRYIANHDLMELDNRTIYVALSSLVCNNYTSYIDHDNMCIDYLESISLNQIVSSKQFNVIKDIVRHNFRITDSEDIITHRIIEIFKAITENHLVLNDRDITFKEKFDLFCKEATKLKRHFNDSSLHGFYMKSEEKFGDYSNLFQMACYYLAKVKSQKLYDDFNKYKKKRKNKTIHKQ